MQAETIFVTGTDTGVGKTLVVGLLARYLLDRGRSVITQKWIQTGSGDFPEDIAAHLQLMGRQTSDIQEYLPYVAPYTFRLPASPHLAAEAEKKKIEASKIKAGFAKLSASFDTVIVEGLGGALVPFNRKELVIDIAEELALPVIIVAKNKLGAINHTLLTIAAVRARNMEISGVIFNSDEDTDKIIADDNPEIIKALTGERILGTLPWSKDPDLLHKTFKPIGDKIFAESAGKLQNG